MSDTVRIYKNSEMFDNTIILSIEDLEVNSTKEFEKYVELYNDETLVGINVFDEEFSKNFSEGFNYPNEANLKIVNDYFSDHNFTYDYNKYLVVGKVVSFEAVKNSRNLNLCQVLANDTTYSIICGASNVEENMKTIVALDKAILPDGVLIKSGLVLNNHSDGMLCSKRELGLKQNPDEIGIIKLDDSEEVNTSFYDIDWRKYDV